MPLKDFRKMEIKTASRKEIEELTPLTLRSIPRWDIISIIDPEDKPLSDEILSSFGCSLTLRFQDLDPLKDTANYMRKFGNVIYKYELFTPLQALSLVNFILDNNTPRLVIHCTAGVSRSVGMKIGLERCFKQTDSSHIEENICYNRFVAALIVDTFYSMERVKTLQIEDKFEKSSDGGSE